MSGNRSLESILPHLRVDSERVGVGDIEDAGTEMRGLALRRIERSRTVPQPPQNLSLVPLYGLALLPTCGRERRWSGKVEKEMTRGRQVTSG